MSEEEIMSLLRSIKEQLNTMEARQIEMDKRQKVIKEEVDSGEQGSFGRRDQ
jgi:hypothetical protein